MALYRLLRIGVLKTDTQQVVVPQSGDLWEAYVAWKRSGNTPDPYVPDPVPPETLAQAKKRRVAELKTEAMAIIGANVPALKDFDTLSLLREIMLSIASAARQPTPDMQWLWDMWQEGENVKSAIQAATTVSQVNSVSANWPTPP